MGAIRELIAKFESEADNKPLEATDGLLDKLAKKSGVVGDGFKRLKGALGGAAIVGGVIGFAHAFVGEVENLQYTSDRLRTTTHDLQLMGAVGRSVGLDLNATAGVLGSLRAKVDEAARGLGDGGYTFRRLGVQVRDSNRQVRPLAQIFGDVATALSGVQRPARQLMLTERLLGSEGRRFISLFAEGRDAIRDFSQIMAESGGGISQESINAGLRLSRAWNIAGLSLDSLKSRIALFLLPKLEWLVRTGTKVLNFFNTTTIAANGLGIGLAAMGAMGARSAAMWAIANLPLIAQFAVIAAGIGVVVVVVDDLINLFTGGQSVIGSFIDEMFGVGAAGETVTYIKGLFDDFLFTVRTITGAIGEFWDSMSIGPNARDNPALRASRTPMRARGVTPGAVGAVDTRALPAGVSATAQANAAESLRRMLTGAAPLPGPRRGREGAPTTPAGASPVQVSPGLSGGRGVAPVMVPAPGGRGAPRASEVNLHSNPAVHVTINNPTGNGADIIRQATPAVRRMLSDESREQVRALQDSGLVSFQGSED